MAADRWLRRCGFVGGAGGILGGLGAAAGGSWKIGRLAGGWMGFDILINLLVLRGRVLWFFQMDAVGPFALICWRAGVVVAGASVWVELARAG